jgi:hypothetical protein
MAPAAAAATAALPPLLVYDDADSGGSYVVIVERPDGQVGFSFHNHVNWTGSLDYEMRYAALLERPGPSTRAVTHIVTATQPYRRNFDLNEFIPFHEVGDYRVQIVYTPMGRASFPAGCWQEEIASEVFTVTILPARGGGATDFGWRRR